MAAATPPPAGTEERADEAQEVSEQFTEAPEALPKVPEEVEDGIHAALIVGKASDGNLL